MFPILFGFWTAEQIAKFFGWTQVNNMKLVNQVTNEVIDKLIAFLQVYEGFESKAYNLGDGKITIGYGSTNWLNPDGSLKRAVKMGDTITPTEAKNQIIYYFAPVISSLRVRLQASNIAILDTLLVSLLQTLYMTGGGAIKYQFFNNILVKCDKNTNPDQVAEIYKSEIVSYFKSLKQSPSSFPKVCAKARLTGYKWDCYGTGWTRRIAASLDLIKGINRPKIWYDRNISKPY